MTLSVVHSLEGEGMEEKGVVNPEVHSIQVWILGSVPVKNDLYKRLVED